MGATSRLKAAPWSNTAVALAPDNLGAVAPPPGSYRRSWPEWRLLKTGGDVGTRTATTWAVKARAMYDARPSKHPRETDHDQARMGTGCVNNIYSKGWVLPLASNCGVDSALWTLTHGQEWRIDHKGVSLSLSLSL